MSVSVVSYGVYLPYLRLKREEYISAWGSCSAEIKEKTVMDVDEDVLTMAVAAAKDALEHIEAEQVSVLALASTSFPYQEKVMAGTIMEALGLPSDVLATHHGHSTLAGTEALLTACSLLAQAGGKYALVVVSDAPSASTAQDIEHSLGAAACAFVLAKEEPGLVLEGAYGYVSEVMGVRYRQAGERGIRDIGVRSFAAQAYTRAVEAAVTGLLKKLECSSEAYRHVVLHYYDLRTTASLGKRLGFSEEQLKGGLVYERIGDTGACSTLLGLCQTMENISPGDRVLVCAYGAGSGSQAVGFVLEQEKPACKTPLSVLLEKKRYISYTHYLKLKGVI
ncbi:hydroxymethylglutaryl-CoA synthase [Desulfovirgula thermocuniculi]|uniref:hydroxymethylglutaryl-CoA synthase n=1 Tax=Desulfovirgula thermocuniculi TaxID=348842 RepID=UPI00041301CF|nr:hydroxymethylglutaryl-CoA synthase [Desulfovirgula thermocuniculi]